MSQLKHSIYVFIFLVAVASVSFASDIKHCGDKDTPSGKKVKVSGTGISLRVGPGTNYEKIVNRKASKILRKTNYVSIDESVTVLEECTNGSWSKIQVIDPDYLNKSHRGWVVSKFLKKLKYTKKWQLVLRVEQ